MFCNPVLSCSQPNGYACFNIISIKRLFYDLQSAALWFTTQWLRVLRVVSTAALGECLKKKNPKRERVRRFLWCALFVFDSIIHRALCVPQKRVLEDERGRRRPSARVWFAKRRGSARRRFETITLAR
jgi:hypothetical protein